jgi:hypothetical protein
LLEKWRYGVKCPIANHGNIAMCKGEGASMVDLILNGMNQGHTY